MTVWKAELRRDVTTRQVDRFFRFIEHDSAAEAQALAEDIGHDANSSCPDDAAKWEEDAPECGDWLVAHLTKATPEEIAEAKEAGEIIGALSFEVIARGVVVAKFAERNDAIPCARLLSTLGTYCDVTAPDGLIAQFRAGVATPEFAHLDAP